jgi:uncharacterized membrane-anchored protein YjiN (DUF445 family)
MENSSKKIISIPKKKIISIHDDYSTNDFVEEVVQEVIPEVVQEVIPEVVQEVIPEVVQEVIPEVVQEVIPEVVQEVIPEVVQEVIPEVVQEVIPEVVQEVIPEVIDRLKNLEFEEIKENINQDTIFDNISYDISENKHQASEHDSDENLDFESRLKKMMSKKDVKSAPLKSDNINVYTPSPIKTVKRGIKKSRV